MKKIEKALLQLGYREASKKPNLFYYNDKKYGVVFFADLRGKEDCPIWQNTMPMFWWHFYNGYSHLEKTRIITKHLSQLNNENCKIETLNWSQCFCGKLFIGEGSFCSSDCERAYMESLYTKCSVCGSVVEKDAMHTHHTQYIPEKTMRVCPSCHTRIHKTDKYPDLKPDDNRQEFEEVRKKKVQARKEERENARIIKEVLETEKREKRRKLRQAKLDERWNRIRKYRYLD